MYFSIPEFLHFVGFSLSFMFRVFIIVSMMSISFNKSLITYEKKKKKSSETY